MSGISVNKSDQQVVSSGAKWTGLANMLVKSINPTLEEMKAFGSNSNKEPVYVTDEIVEEKNGVASYTYKKNRLSFTLYHPGHKFYSYLSIWLESRVRANQKGDKIEWINKFGQTCWTSGLDVLGSDVNTWFKADMQRPAFGGEGKLTKFIQCWANSNTDGQCILDNPKALAEGDYKEIKSLFSLINTNEVQVLNGVKKAEKDGKINFYQTIYDGHLDRATSRNYAGWKTALANEFGKFEADYQGDLDLKPFKDTAVKQDAPTNMNVPDAGGAPSGYASVPPGQGKYDF